MKYCDNPTCDAEAVETVPVTVARPSDETRNYCYTCYEAYIVGCQHGRANPFEHETIPANKTYRLVSEHDGNDYADLTAQTEAEAWAEALSTLGYSLTIADK